MQTSTRAAGLAMLVFGVAGIAWFALAATPPSLGYEDTDDPALMLRFARTFPTVFVQEGMALLTMSISLTVATISTAEVLGRRIDRVALRSITAFGLFGAAAFFVAGALRVNASGPAIHIAGLDESWGQAAFVAIQVGGQALLISGLFMVGLWSVGVSILGYRANALPTWLCALGALPAVRLVMGLLGPLGLLPAIGLLWPLWMAAILGTMLWYLLLGAVLLRTGFARDGVAPPAS